MNLNRTFALACTSLSIVGFATGAVAQDITLNFGLSAVDVEQSDDTISEKLLGMSGGVSLAFPLSATMRGYFEADTEIFFLPSDEDDFEDVAPTKAAFVGLRIENDTTQGTWGGFAGVGLANSEDGDDGEGVGPVLGVNGLFDVGGTDVFGTLGYANVRTDGDDSGFTGPFAELGALFEVGSNGLVKASIGYGSSSDYEDTDDDGTYQEVAVSYLMQPASMTNATIEFGLSHTKYEANTEDDGTENRLFAIMSIPLGGSQTLKQAARPLAVPLTPMRSAGYGSVLD